MELPDTHLEALKRLALLPACVPPLIMRVAQSSTACNPLTAFD
jgi:hypothetical protein